MRISDWSSTCALPICNSAASRVTPTCSGRKAFNTGSSDDASGIADGASGIAPRNSGRHGASRFGMNRKSPCHCELPGDGRKRRATRDQKRVVKGNSVEVSVDRGGSSIIKKKKKNKNNTSQS